VPNRIRVLLRSFPFFRSVGIRLSPLRWYAWPRAFFALAVRAFRQSVHGRLQGSPHSLRQMRRCFRPDCQAPRRLYDLRQPQGRLRGAPGKQPHASGRLQTQDELDRPILVGPLEQYLPAVATGAGQQRVQQRPMPPRCGPCHPLHLHALH